MRRHRLGEERRLDPDRLRRHPGAVEAHNALHRFREELEPLNLSRGPVLIRRASAEDAEAVAQVLEASFESLRHRYTARAYQATVISADVVLERLDEGPLWLAMSGAAAVGTLSGVLTKTGLYLRGMGVVPDARGRHLGRRLLERAEDFGRRRGASRLYLSTTPFLAAAIRVYTSYGFQRIDEGPYDLFATPLFTMEKNCVPILPA